MTRPIQGLSKPGAAPALAGAWGAYILAIDATGFTVNIPTLTGQLGSHSGCEAIPGTYAAGDPVWVMAIEGNRGRFLIIGHRQRTPT